MKENIKSFKVTWEITCEDIEDIYDIECYKNMIKDQLECLASCIEARQDLLIIKDLCTNENVLLEDYGNNI